MELTIMNLIQIATSILTIGITYGNITQKLNHLNEKFDDIKVKVEKHNNFMERIAKVEERSKSNSHRLDGVDRELEKRSMER